jgi:hypothetical protein
MKVHTNDIGRFKKQVETIETLVRQLLSSHLVLGFDTAGK